MKAKPKEIPLWIVTAICAAALLIAPMRASADGVSRSETSIGGDTSGDPDQPDPTKVASPVLGSSPKLSGTYGRGYLDSENASVSRSSLAGVPSRGWLEALLWSLRARIGW